VVLCDRTHVDLYRTGAVRRVAAILRVPYPLARILVDGASVPSLAHDAAILNPMVDGIDRA
jgi:hypothetical protein